MVTRKRWTHYNMIQHWATLHDQCEREEKEEEEEKERGKETQRQREKEEITWLKNIFKRRRRIHPFHLWCLVGVVCILVQGVWSVCVSDWTDQVEWCTRNSVVSTRTQNTWHTSQIDSQHTVKHSMTHMTAHTQTHTDTQHDTHDRHTSQPTCHPQHTHMPHDMADTQHTHYKHKSPPNK